jgi:hypothetical protein
LRKVIFYLMCVKQSIEKIHDFPLLSMFLWVSIFSSLSFVVRGHARRTDLICV